ncbi:hypothetical protein BX616_002506 [Lobosporangium transversale]|nr:hypothetical protein BX616_002506 [Lobosporangium transversale]
MFIEGKGLYISGGAPQPETATSQAFMIDLSVSWNASSPVYRPLADGPYGLSIPSALSADGENWFLLVNSTGHVYNMRTGSWDTIFASVRIGTELAFGIAAVTDPNTGIIYIPNGHEEVHPFKQWSMLTVDVKAKKFDNVPMMQGLNRTGLYAVAWSNVRGEFILTGGFAPGIFAYSPKNGWSALNVSGSIPSHRHSQCLVPAYGGKKLIMFGGHSSAMGLTLNDLHILDVASLTWTAAPSIDALNRRQESACAVSGDYLIVWGGRNTGTVEDFMASKTPLIFNMKTNKWTSTYIAPRSSTTTTSSATTTGTSPPSNSPTETVGSSGGSSVPVIAGAVAGVLVVLIAFLGILWYRRRAAASKNQDSYTSTVGKPPGDSGEAISKEPIDTCSRSSMSNRMADPLSRNKSSNNSTAYPSPPPVQNVNSTYFSGEYANSNKSSPRNPSAIVDERMHSYQSNTKMRRPPQMGAYGASRLSQHPHTDPIGRFEQDKQPPVQMNYYVAPPPVPSNPQVTTAYHIPTSNFQ